MCNADVSFRILYSSFYHLDITQLTLAKLFQLDETAAGEDELATSPRARWVDLPVTETDLLEGAARAGFEAFLAPREL